MQTSNTEEMVTISRAEYERLHGMQEVSGSIPLSSTKFLGSLSSRGLGHDPFTVGTGVRIPVGTPQLKPALCGLGYL